MLKNFRLYSRLVYAVPLLLFLTRSLPAQDIYDYPNTRLFANYLMQSRQYALASQEYERLVFMQPGNDTLRGGVLRSLRLAGKPELGLQRWNAWQLETPGRLLRNEYAKLLLVYGDYGQVHTLAATPDLLDENIALRLDLYAFMLRQSWPQARERLNAWPSGTRLPRRMELESLVQRGQNQHYKNPAMAAALSAVVPGLGKAYSGQWKDGLISLVFVGLNTWQGIRRFDKEGADTFWGYVHGGFALGYYISGIYGSHKAARLQNQRQRHKLLHETELLVLPALD